MNRQLLFSCPPANESRVGTANAKTNECLEPNASGKKSCLRSDLFLTDSDGAANNQERWISSPSVLLEKWIHRSDLSIRDAVASVARQLMEQPNPGLTAGCSVGKKNRQVSLASLIGAGAAQELGGPQLGISTTGTQAGCSSPALQRQPIRPVWSNSRWHLAMALNLVLPSPSDESLHPSNPSERS